MTIHEAKSPTKAVCLRIVYAELGVLRQLLDLLGIMPGPFFCFAQVLLLSQMICVFATKKWSVTLNIDNKSTLTFSTPT